MHFHRVRSLPKRQFRTRSEQGLRNHIEDMKVREQMIALDVAVKTQQLQTLKDERWNLERDIPVWAAED